MIYKKFRESRQRITTKGAKTSSLAKNRKEAETALAMEAPEFNLDKLDELYDAGKFDPNEAFQVVYDKESMIREAGPRGERLQMFQKKGRLYYSEQGDTLNDPTIGREARLRDPFETLSRELNEAVKQAAWKDYAIQSTGLWHASFGKYYTADVVLPQPDELLKYGTWNMPNKPEWNKIKNYSENQRQYILRMLEHPTESDIKIARFKSRVAQATSNYYGKKGTKYEALRSGRIVTEAQALQTLHSLTFDAYMGFMNLAQLILQGSAIATAVMISPAKGASAIKDLIPLRIASMFDFQPTLVKTLDKIMSTGYGKATLGYRPGEFLALVEDYRKSGVHIVGRTNALVDNAGISSAARLGPTSSWLMNTSEKVANGYNVAKAVGRQPFYEMERWGRIVGFGIARREAEDLVALS